jgi:hypothetical protein
LTPEPRIWRGPGAYSSVVSGWLGGTPTPVARPTTGHHDHNRFARSGRV